MQSKTAKVLKITAVTTLAGLVAFLIWQYNKIMSYTVKVVGKKIIKVSTQEVIFDLMVQVTNNSLLPITIKSQQYNVYLNNNFVTGVAAKKQSDFKPNTSTVIPLRIDINPKDVTKALGANGLLLLLTPEKVIITVALELSVKIIGIGAIIKNTSQTSLADLLHIKAPPVT